MFVSLIVFDVSDIILLVNFNDRRGYASRSVKNRVMISPEEKIKSPLRRAIVFALGYQIPLLLLSLMATDGGQIGQICLFAFVAFWGGAIITIWRRRLNPTKFDIFIIRAGYVPLCVITVLLTSWIWELRGF